MILLSLTSKQTWPHVLTTHHLRPDSLVLLHSDDPDESRNPAGKIKVLFESTEIMPKESVSLHLLPHDDFNGIHQALDSLLHTRQIQPEKCILNITGGNKLMACSAVLWARSKSIRACYLERGNSLIWLEPKEGVMRTSSERIPPSICDALDPLDLLKCQTDVSEVERDGEAITLSKNGENLSTKDFLSALEKSSFSTDLLNIQGKADPKPKKGDDLELRTAAVLLKLGVHMVRRSIRLKVASRILGQTRSPHAEFDLLFNWSGRLWLVDCKDRVAPSRLVKDLRSNIIRDWPHLDPLLKRIDEELSTGQTKTLKEDILAIREIGGLLGRVVCVRKANMEQEVSEFARRQKIDVVRKRNLYSDLEALLYPDRPANLQNLKDLESRFRGSGSISS